MISVIVPIYNSEKYLEECLSSIRVQSYEDFEVICVDDGSVDSSREICSSFVESDNRFHLYKKENGGVSLARNFALGVATGDYVCFIDSDDTIHKDYLKNLISNIQDCDSVICDYSRSDNLGGGDSIILKSPGTLINEIVFERIKHPNIVCLLYDRRIIEQNSIRFTEGCIKNEDYEFYMKYLAACKRDIALLEFVGYYYRPNPSSVMLTPLSLKSLTSIEASGRINKVLYDAGLIADSEIVLSNGVLTYAYSIARQRNSELYDYLHEHYDVKSAMKKMLSFPRISKRLVAVAYLILGRTLFFNLVGFQRIQK